MAPQNERGTYYGSLKMDESTATKSRSSGKLIALAGVLLVGVVCFAGTQMMQTGSISAEQALNLDLGDCTCLTDCSATADADGLHWCDVESVDATTCMGSNLQSPACDETGANCQAVCQFVYGRYDCWQEDSCIHGFCVDGQDDYDCVCDFGYGGADCGDNINECAYTAAGFKVCDANADCEDSDGMYSCECNAGWEGDGYVPDGSLSAGDPAWVTRGAILGCSDIDMCLNNPCHNGGTCSDVEGTIGQDGYVCTCVDGPTNSKAFVGHECQDNVDECVENLHDCDPHATCHDTHGSFVCTCNQNWESLDGTGVDREGRADDVLNIPGCYDVQDCLSQPCINGGTCTDSGNGCVDIATGNPVRCYTCDCAYGWSGEDCEIDENECTNSDVGNYNTELHDCNEHALCTNTPGGFVCSCNAGWTGTGYMTDGCVDADDCEFNPCAHGGTCGDCGNLCFFCDCVIGWRGTTCATDWNECTLGIHMCNDDATCVNTPGSYDCVCDPGFTGNGFGGGVGSGSGYQTMTETHLVGATEVVQTYIQGCKDIDDCDPELFSGNAQGPCIQGDCDDVGANAFICHCYGGYTDSTCDMDVNECDPILGSNNCHRFATCTNTEGSYTCECNDGYEGDGVGSCLDTDDCDGQCTHGFCSDLGVNDFKCTCDSGYTDRLCDSDLNECMDYTHECSRNSICTNTDGSYTCACKNGWQGDGLEAGTQCTEVDDCASSPCQNGVCTDTGVDAYSCDCDDGWTDFNCDFDINECYLKQDNCHVDARCVNVPGAFFCRCLSGYAGDGQTCTNIDDCADGQIGFGACHATQGTCADDGANKFRCDCEDGYEGLTCSQDLNECAAGVTNACDPDATCINGEGSYSCVCNGKVDGYNAPGAFGDGYSCQACTICATPAYVVVAGTQCSPTADRQCEDINECTQTANTIELADGTMIGGNNCAANSDCTNLIGDPVTGEDGFKCDCSPEFFGDGVSDGVGCAACRECSTGYYESLECAPTQNRQCTVYVETGLYTMTSEADGNKNCIAIVNGEWYPSRVNEGNGDDYCGIACTDAADCETELRTKAELLWKLTHLADNNEDNGIGSSYANPSGLYTIESSAKNGVYNCLFFGNDGKDIYPSLQNCDYKAVDDNSECPWETNGEPNPEEEAYCGFHLDGYTAKQGLLNDGNAVWKITPLKINENKYLLQSASREQTEGINAGNKIWECLAFEQQGSATNPSRYNWGNGDTWCGVADWDGEGKEIALLNNKQAVIILDRVTSGF